jgi:heme/copper-type cytochrome/quinol oxidase subunit 3
MSDAEVKKMLDFMMIALLLILSFLMFGLTEWASTVVDERSDDK